MPFGIPIALFGGGGSYTLSFTSDTYIGDLFTYVGSPTEPVNVEITVDNCDVSSIFITNSFNASSTFSVTCINGGRVIGTGGNGGRGADDFGATGDRGTPGSSGGHAITAAGFNVSVDIDDGYLYGGGGGGGGGGFNDRGTVGDPGGGGGGGQGWGTSTGGAAGTPSGFPIAEAGGNGSVAGPGASGEGGAVGTNDGGVGGAWGEAGGYGGWPDPGLIGIIGSAPGDGCGTMGGNAGSAFYPTSGGGITLAGAKSEATLRTESRLIGEIFGKAVLTDWRSATDFIVGTGASSTITWTFLNNGKLRRIIDGSIFDYSTEWYVGSGFTAGDYSVMYPANTEGGLGGWETGMASDTWYNLASSSSVSISANSVGDTAISGFLIRRDSTGDVIASGVLTATIEWEP